MLELDLGPTRQPYWPQPVDYNDLMPREGKRMLIVTDQSCKQHPSILPLATLGGEAAASRALFAILILHSTIGLTLMESE